MRNMNTGIIRYFMCAVILSAACACSTKFEHKPIGQNSGEAPGPVSNIRVTNVNGGAVLHYDIPDDPDVLYVKALLTNVEGDDREVVASVYVDSLIIEGLADTRERKVELYAVNHYENCSECATVMINPLEPPVQTVFKSLQMVPNFGGFTLSFENPSKASVSFYIYSWSTEKGEYVLYQVLTSEAVSGSLSVKGFDCVEQHFAVMVRDKYDNMTSKFEKSLVPLYEEKLDKTKFIWLNCVGDEDWNQHSGHSTWLYNDVIGGWDWGHTAYPTPFPHSFTIDLGVSAKLSQFAMWQRQDNDDLLYAHGAPKHFKLYGCKENLDYRDNENWITLFDGYLEKPSGGDFNDPNTEEDIQMAREGHVFTIDQSAPAVRFFRFESLASWSGMECTVLSEITIWGNPQAE